MTVNLISWPSPEDAVFNFVVTSKRSQNMLRSPQSFVSPHGFIRLSNARLGRTSAYCTSNHRTQSREKACIKDRWISLVQEGLSPLERGRAFVRGKDLVPRASWLAHTCGGDHQL